MASSKKAIYGAIIANTLIAISKFVGSFFTGSSAMLSEGIHSLVDTTNGALLLYGIKESKREPDKQHPFGYGLSVYFWSFIVAILVFALGGGVALYEGIHHIQHPVPVTDPTWNYVILGLAIIFEGSSYIVAVKEFKKSQDTSKGLIRSIRISKDAPTFVIIIEDSAALIGLVIAFLGILLGDLTGIVYFDGGASILIGLLLSYVAYFLAKESQSLLIGESMHVEEVDHIAEIVKNHPEVLHLAYPKTLHFGPASVLLVLDIEFKDHLTTDDIEKVIIALEDEIKEAYPIVDKIYIESKSIHHT